MGFWGLGLGFWGLELGVDFSYLTYAHCYLMVEVGAIGKQGFVGHFWFFGLFWKNLWWNALKIPKKFQKMMNWPSKVQFCRFFDILAFAIEIFKKWFFLNFFWIFKKLTKIWIKLLNYSEMKSILYIINYFIKIRFISAHFARRIPKKFSGSLLSVCFSEITRKCVIFLKKWKNPDVLSRKFPKISYVRIRIYQHLIQLSFNNQKLTIL